MNACVLLSNGPLNVFNISTPSKTSLKLLSPAIPTQYIFSSVNEFKQAENPIHWSKGKKLNPSGERWSVHLADLFNGPTDIEFVGFDHKSYVFEVPI